MIALAVEKAAQGAIACRAGLADTFEHAIDRHASVNQGVRSEHHRRFQGLRHHLGGTGALQLLEVFIINGTHNHRQPRLQLPHVAQHLLGGADINKRNNQHAGTANPGCHQRFTLGGIAINNVFTGCRGFAYAIRIKVERDISYPFVSHETRQMLTATPETANHRVLVRTQRARCNTGQLQGSHQPFVGGKAQDQTVAVMDDNRRQQHGEHHRRQHHLHGQRWRNGRPFNFREQDKAKLATGAKPQPGTHGAPGHRPEQT